ncbi:MAG: hypothetical protein IT337_15995 [Thermomicrobiales bacterium]|nr:hypothetical protein [Thermomicrobiales bacterium]
MESQLFDAMTARFAARRSRRGLLATGARVGAGAALALVAGRRAASAQTCPYGANTCAQGYVWREAFPGDVACVDPSQRDQAAYDNASQASRVDPNGPYGPLSCISGYVWRDAYDGDGVCVEPWVRDQVHYDNSQAAARIAPGCGYQTST